MTDYIPYLLAPAALGLLAHILRLPPLLGFLAAGIALNLAGYPKLDTITALGDLGVTLLLFTIGLKLDIRLLLRREVWLTSSLHMFALSLAGAGVVSFFFVLGLAGTDVLTFQQASIIGFALSFSSTVLVVKTLDERSESRSLYGRTAIGVLIIQDIFAVLFMALAGDNQPSIWAFALLGLLPASWLFRKGLSKAGHGELLVFYGVFLAFVPGYWLFDFFHLKGDLGALIIGMLIAGHPKSNELSRTLYSLKEFMLVGFFVSIGLLATPTLEQVALAFFLLALLPLNFIIYVSLLRSSGLSARSSVLSALALTNFSEFALIVTAVATSQGLLPEEWLTVISLAVAFSFLASTLLNIRGSKLPRHLIRRLPQTPEHLLHPEERPVYLSNARALVIGMGRLGASAYTVLSDKYGLPVIGIDNSESRVKSLLAQGYQVVEADATDPAFWQRVKTDENIDLVLLAMPAHGTNIDAMREVIEAESKAAIAVVSQHIDELQDLEDLGADVVLNLYAGAGEALAEDGYRVMPKRSPSNPS